MRYLPTYVRKGLTKIKRYVEVFAKFDAYGNIYPTEIIWESGISFKIDKILDISPCASLKCSGFGTRYTVRIKRTITYLFLEENRWFVENKC